LKRKCYCSKIIVSPTDQRPLDIAADSYLHSYICVHQISEEDDDFTYEGGYDSDPSASSGIAAESDGDDDDDGDAGDGSESEWEQWPEDGVVRSGHNPRNSAAGYAKPEQANKYAEAVDTLCKCVCVCVFMGMYACIRAYSSLLSMCVPRYLGI
jgi:hypothetical protein